LKKEKNNYVFKYIICNSNEEIPLFVTLEFLNKITFCEKEYYFLLNEEKPLNPLQEQSPFSKDLLLDNEILNILITFMNSKLSIWTSPRFRLVRNSASNLISNLIRKFWLVSLNPEKIIDNLVSLFFMKVISLFINFIYNKFFFF